MNTVKTTLLLTVMTAFLVLVGGMLGGKAGLIIAFGLAVVMNFSSYWFSDKIVLKLYSAEEISENESPEIHSMVAKLAVNAGIPKPDVYKIDSDTPNAFATGRNPEHGTVALTTGLLNRLNREEIEGVIAHELSHIKNRDTLISAIAATLAGAIMILSRIAYFSALFGGAGGGRDRGNPIVLLASMIVAPIAALLIRSAISRTREYKADADGAEISGNPGGLASALRKMEAVSQQAPMKNAKQNTSHMFIVNPLSGKGLAGLFSSHPPTEKRIAKLEDSR